MPKVEIEAWENEVGKEKLDEIDQKIDDLSEDIKIIVSPTSGEGETLPSDATHAGLGTNGTAHEQTSAAPLERDNKQ